MATPAEIASTRKPIRLRRKTRQANRSPTDECIREAAIEAGIHPDVAFLAVSGFMEALVQRIAHGEIVQLDGFGVFAAAPHMVKGRKNEGLPPVPSVRFSACRAFRQYTAATCPIKPSNGDYVRRHSYSNNIGDPNKSLKLGRTTGRVPTAFKKQRDTLRKRSTILKARKGG